MSKNWCFFVYNSVNIWKFLIWFSVLKSTPQDASFEIHKSLINALAIFFYIMYIFYALWILLKILKKYLSIHSSNFPLLYTFHNTEREGNPLSRLNPKRRNACLNWRVIKTSPCFFFNTCQTMNELCTIKDFMENSNTVQRRGWVVTDYKKFA